MTRCQSRCRAPGVAGIRIRYVISGGRFDFSHTWPRRKETQTARPLRYREELHIRILILTNLFPPHHVGGYELRCGDVATALRARGHDVAVLTSDYRTQCADRQDSAPASRCFRLHWGPPHAPEALEPWLRREIEDRLAIAARWNAFRPDVTAIWGMEFASQPMVDWLLRSPAPRVVMLEDIWLRDAYQRDPLSQLGGLASRLAVNVPPCVAEILRPSLQRPDPRGGTVAYVSNALRESYHEVGAAFQREHVLLAGIELDAYRSLSPPPPPPPLVILTAGQLTASRGQRDLIEALAQLDPARVPFPLVLRIAGSGNPSYENELRSLAERAGGPRLRVELVGKVNPQEMPALYERAHLFVHTSRLPEGLPRVIAEAQAAGLPVIATNTGGQRDLLKDGQWGELVSPGDPGVLATAIGRVLADWEANHARAQARRAAATDRYCPRRYVDRYETLLADAAGENRAAASALQVTPIPGNDLSAFCDRLRVAALGAARRMNAENDPVLTWQLGSVLKRSGELAAARRMFLGLLEAHPDDITHFRRATFHLGEIAASSGDENQARSYLQRCLDAAPDHRKAAYDLRCLDEGICPDHLRAIKAAQPRPPDE